MPPALTLAGVAVEPGRAATPYWLTGDRVSSSASGYDTKTMLHSLIDQVSKGSNLLLNIIPMADGTIPPDQRSILLGTQDWLGRFGEAIQATRMWSAYGEGPTRMGGGLFAGPVAGTPRDIRFTRTQDNTVLYATTLGWQGGTTTIRTLGANRMNLGNLASVQLLDNTAGRYANLTGYHQDDGLHITMPSSNPPFVALAYVFKLTFTGQIPVLGAPTPVERTTR